jgi:hypothetical protein
MSITRATAIAAGLIALAGPLAAQDSPRTAPADPAQATPQPKAKPRPSSLSEAQSRPMRVDRDDIADPLGGPRPGGNRWDPDFSPATGRAGLRGRF